MAQTQFSRFDKYNGFVGGFRAALNAAMSATGDDIGKIQGVSINSSGRVVIGAAAETQIIGLICPVKVMSAGDIIDVMTSGEIVSAVKTAGTAFAAGDIVTVAITGAVGATAVGAGFKAVAHMIELDRMVVRCPIPTVA